MRDNIVKAIIKNDTHINTQSVYQYDYGLKLMVEGIELPEFYEVHFINKNDNTAYVVHGSPEGVDIPDTLLQTGMDIIAWMYVHTGDDDGETAYDIRIPVIKRAVITDAPIPEPEQREIDQVMAELRRGVAISEENAEITEENVEKTEQNVLHYPYINQLNKHWMCWDATENAFVDTGIEAIGERGKLENMRIGTVDTLPAGEPATASVEVGDDEIILNLGLPTALPTEGMVLFEEQTNRESVSFEYGANNVAISAVTIDVVPQMTGSGVPSPSNLRRLIPRSGVTIYHNNTEHMIEFGIPGGVAGGIYNPLTGKLTVDRVIITKRCVEMDNTPYAPGWKNVGIRDLIGADVRQVYTGQILNVGTSYAVDTTDGNDILYLDYDQYHMTQAQWIATEIDVQICLMLAEPVEYDLAGVMMRTEFGHNDFAASTGNIRYIKYPCDPKLYIDQKIASVQALVLEHE